jgi:acyl carrier protein
MSSTPSVTVATSTTAEAIATELERFLRTSFDIPDDDEGFGRDVDVFGEGYVDSVGVVEVVSFLEARYRVTIPEDALFDPRFTCVRGMAEIVAALAT